MTPPHAAVMWINFTDAGHPREVIFEAADGSQQALAVTNWSGIARGPRTQRFELSSPVALKGPGTPSLRNAEVVTLMAQLGLTYRQADELPAAAARWLLEVKAL